MADVKIGTVTLVESRESGTTVAWLTVAWDVPFTGEHLMHCSHPAGQVVLTPTLQFEAATIPWKPCWTATWC